MKQLESVAMDGPALEKEEKLEIFDLQLLFAQAPEELQARAMRRINPLLEAGRVDSRRLMKTVREVSKELRDALEGSGPAQADH